jgi:hypothetical protein
MEDPRQPALQVEIWFTLYRLRCIQEPAQYAAADARLGRLRTYQELIK